jgi:hypothetical protein
MSDTVDDDSESDVDVRDHLSEIEDGCGCVEIWEQLSDSRADTD